MSCREDPVLGSSPPRRDRRGGRARAAGPPNVVVSQATLHAEFGGVVPEVAGLPPQAIGGVIDSALDEAGDPRQPRRGGNTAWPGLIGSLLVGVSAATACSTSGPPRWTSTTSRRTCTPRPWSRRRCAPASRWSFGATRLLRRAEPSRGVDRLHARRRRGRGLRQGGLDPRAQLPRRSVDLGPRRGGRSRAIRFPRYSPKTPPGAPRARSRWVLFRVEDRGALPRPGRGRAGPLPGSHPGPRRHRRELQRPCDLVTQTLRGGPARGAPGAGRRRGSLQSASAGPDDRARRRDRRPGLLPEPRPLDNAVMIAGLGWERLRAGRTADLGLDAAPR